MQSPQGAIVLAPGHGLEQPEMSFGLFVDYLRALISKYAVRFSLDTSLRLQQGMQRPDAE